MIAHSTQGGGGGHPPPRDARGNPRMSSLRGFESLPRQPPGLSRLEENHQKREEKPYSRIWWKISDGREAGVRFFFGFRLAKVMRGGVLLR